MKQASPFSAMRGSDTLFPNDFEQDLFALLWIKEEIAKCMATEFQGDLTYESILQEMDDNIELAGDEQILGAPGMCYCSSF